MSTRNLVNYATRSSNSFDDLVAKDTLLIPTTNNIGTFPVASAGSLAYEIPSETLYTSDGTSWNTISGAGEANTASNLVTTGEGLFFQKMGVDLQFRRVEGVDGISTSTSVGEVVEISAGLGGGSSIVGTTDTQTLTNKTHTGPIIDEILDSNSNEMLTFSTTNSAVNELTITNASAASAPKISATGDDTDVTLCLNPKGSGSVDVSSSKITSVSNPTDDQDAATKAYVDSVATGLNPLEASLVGTTADLGATYAAGGGTSGTGEFTLVPTTIDGVGLSVTDRVLVKDQTDATENGIYEVTAVGATATIERSSDFDGTVTGPITGGSTTFVESGTTNGGTTFVVQGAGTLVVNTDDINWVKLSENTTFTAGDGIDITAGVISTDIQANGGLVIDTTELTLDLGANSIGGTLTPFNGGTGLSNPTTDNVLITDGANTMTLKSNPTGAFVGDTDTQTLTNKTLVDLTNNVAADEIQATGGNVVLSLTQPSSGQILTSTSSTTAQWSDPINDDLQVTYDTDTQNTLILEPSSSLSETNIGMALQLKGTGALTLVDPDGSATGGDSRGNSSIDLQISRTLDTQVASGNLSAIISGRDNLVGTTRSGVFIGDANSISSTGAGSDIRDSAIIGGITNSIVTTVSNSNVFHSFILGGNSNTIDGASATFVDTISSSGIIGGLSNVIISNTPGNVGDWVGSVIVGGTTNTITGNPLYSIIAGSENSTIDSGTSNIIIGGEDHSIETRGVGAPIDTKDLIIGGSGCTIDGTILPRNMLLNSTTSTLSSVERSNVIGGINCTIATSNASSGPITYSTILSSQTSLINGGGTGDIDGCVIIGGSGLQIDTTASASAINNSMICGGADNDILNTSGTVDNSVICGGIRNTLDSSNYSSIVGGKDNTLSGGGVVKTILGGDTLISSTTGANSILGGGITNTLAGAGDNSVLLGGSSNSLAGSEDNHVLLGGTTNTRSGAGFNTAILGGTGATISGVSSSSILGGNSNTIESGGDNSSILAGSNNRVSTGSESIIIGGGNNRVSGSKSAIVAGGSDTAGDRNTISGDNCVILGGQINTVSSTNSAIVAGNSNEVEDTNSNSAIIAGEANRIATTASESIIVGGENNVVSGNKSGIFAGGSNTPADGNNVSGNGSVILGGDDNTISNNDSSICGGQTNSISGQRSAVIGGTGNTVTGDDSVLIGGDGATVSDNEYVRVAKRFGTEAVHRQIRLDTNEVSGTTNLNDRNHVVIYNANPGLFVSRTWNLPDAASDGLLDGREIVAFHRGNSNVSITVATTDGSVLDGPASLSQNEGAMYYYCLDDDAWYGIRLN